MLQKSPQCQMASYGNARPWGAVLNNFGRPGLSARQSGEFDMGGGRPTLHRRVSWWGCVSRERARERRVSVYEEVPGFRLGLRGAVRAHHGSLAGMPCNALQSLVL
jgi:hypothetical protein